MTEHVERDLTHLPEPAAPGSLSRIVMARVTRLAEERPAFNVAGSSMARSSEGRVTSWSETPAWLTALAGLAIVFVAWIDAFVSWVDGRLEASSFRDLLSQIPTPNVTGGGPNPYALLPLAVGLILYLAGLLAPLRRGHAKDR